MSKYSEPAYFIIYPGVYPAVIIALRPDLLCAIWIVKVACALNQSHRTNSSHLTNTVFVNMVLIIIVFENELALGTFPYLQFNFKEINKGKSCKLNKHPCFPKILYLVFDTFSPE